MTMALDALPASCDPHRFMRAVESPSTASYKICRTSERLYPSSMSCVNDLPVFSCRIPATSDPASPSSLIMLLRYVVDSSVLMPALVIEM